MSKELIESDDLTKVVSIWETEEKLLQIKELFAPKLSTSEFSIFVEMGKSLGLNPFLREIWAVKFGTNPPQIFVGRDGYRKVMSRSANFDYTVVDAVYENDSFSVEAGDVKHTYSLKNRGKLMGAYCTVKMKHSTKPFYVFADLAEYNLKQSLWNSKPATMIKKVAEAQAMRMACTALNGTYDESEYWKKDAIDHVGASGNAAEMNDYIKNLTHSDEDLPSVSTTVTPDFVNVSYEVVQSEFDSLADRIANSQSIEQLMDISQEIPEKNLSDEERANLRKVFALQRSRLLTE